MCRNVIELDMSWNIMKPFPTDTQFFLRVYAGLVMMVQHQIISFRCPKKTFPDRGAVVWKLGYIHWWIIIKLAMFLGWIIHMPDITVSYSQRPVGYTHKMCCCRPCSTWSASLVVASRILLCRRQGFCFWILGSGGSCRGQTWNFHGICWSLSDPSYLISA